MRDTYPELSEATNVHVHMVMATLPYTDRKLEDVRKHTSEDPVLQILRQTVGLKSEKIVHRSF
ncbi:hypothetical protein DPMN_031510 [Dreissena polymorpha]|uniref:Uncharacterized protein n=1 Tax=Dreissena polymorpha TaxID=45954 RepID=A0A9D4RH61_DREPO|nr:hypothetical protein DPMN_031510 [Dreissena polymorpha]